MLEGLENRNLLATGPEMLVDLNPGTGIWSREFTAVGDTVYFTNGGTDLWKTGGTPASTEKVATITHSDLSESAAITDFVDAGGVLAFVVFDYGIDPSFTDDDRVQFWKSDGTPGGTVMVADLGLGSTLPDASGDAHLTAVGSQVFGVISTPTAGYELWVSDLNPANPTGTHLVKDIFPGANPSYLDEPNSSYPSDLLAFGGKLYFAADDGEHGVELWGSDGTGGGTQMVKDVNPTVNDGSYPSGLTAGNDEFFFGTVNPGADRVELWKSDGTGAGTNLVHAFELGTSPPVGSYGDDSPQLTYIPETDKLFGVVEFQDGSVRSQDLVCWDGAAMHHWNLYTDGDDAVGNLSPAFGQLGFAADDGVHGREPWLTDGNSENPLGTSMIKDVDPGDGSGIDAFKAGVAPFPAVAGSVYFPASDGVNGIELWRSDGTEGGTVLVADIRPGAEFGEPNSSYPYDLTAAQGKLFFGALDDNQSYNPWVLAPSDIQVQQATADGAQEFQVAYQIDGDAMPVFDFGFFLSNDPFFDPSDTQLDTATIGDPADRTAGPHSKIFTIGTGVDEIALPGAGVAETNDEYYILVVADPEDLISETDADPFQEDNTVPLIGVYHPPGSDVFVHGTQDADQIAVSSGSLRIVVNGATLTYDLATTTGLRVRGHAGNDVVIFNTGSGFPATPALPLFLHGGGGSDTATLVDSTGGVLATLSPGGGTVSGLGYAVTLASAETINAIALSGGQAVLNDSAGADQFYGTPTGGTLLGTGFTNYVQGFNPINAFVTPGTGDSAVLYDSAGADQFYGTPTGGTLLGSGYTLYAQDFDQLAALATPGTGDSAVLYDSAGADQFYGTPTSGVLLGSGYNLYVQGFGQVAALATAGTGDSAVLYDSAGADQFYGTPTSTTLRGIGYNLNVQGFGQVAGLATAGTGDTAALYDSANADQFYGTPTSATLLGTGYNLYVQGFAGVGAVATPGTGDLAALWDSAGADQFYSTPSTATLQGAGYSINVQGFAQVGALATAGTGDSASMFDSAGADQIYATPVTTTLWGTAYRVNVQHFDQVNLFATPGTGDAASLFDSAGADQFYGTPTGATLLGTGYSLYIQGCGQVNVFATPGTSDAASLFDSAGADQFYGTPTGATLLGTGYTLYAQGFDAVGAIATPGSGDLAVFYDSAGADQFTGTSTGASLVGTGYNHAVQGFDRVYLAATPGGLDEVDLYDGPTTADVLSVAGNEFDFITGGRRIGGSGLAAAAHLRAYASGGGDTLYEDAVDYLFEHFGDWTPG